jgi:drug/metabolite transporter (DMT)-like permease
VTSALFGMASALALGTADFMARSSARVLGAIFNYFLVLLIGAIGSTIWVFASGTNLVWSGQGIALATAHGICVSLMCMLLYAGLARGPVGIVAPIVATHPALVLAINVAMGLRASAVQWLAIAVILAGGVAIARSAPHKPQGDVDGGGRGVTLSLAFAACIAYAAFVVTGQMAVPLLGGLETMWIGRCAGLVFVAILLLIRRAPPALDRNWLPFVGVQGVLDMLGYFAFLAGSNTASPHVTMILSSSFSVITVLLARIFLKEPVSIIQWCAITLIALGTIVLILTR